MNNEFLIAAQTLHSMIMIKTDDLIDPNRSYPCIRPCPGTFLGCFVDDIPALAVVADLCVIGHLNKVFLIVNKTTQILQPAAQQILCSLGNKTISTSAISLTRRPNLIVVVSQSRYLLAKKYFGRVFGIPEDFETIFNACETLRPQLLKYLDESFRFGFNNRDYMNISDEVVAKNKLSKTGSLHALKAQMFQTWIKGYEEYKSVEDNSATDAIAAFVKKAKEIAEKN